MTVGALSRVVCFSGINKMDKLTLSKRLACQRVWGRAPGIKFMERRGEEAGVGRKKSWTVMMKSQGWPEGSLQKTLKLDGPLASS